MTENHFPADFDSWPNKWAAWYWREQLKTLEALT